MAVMNDLIQVTAAPAGWNLKAAAGQLLTAMRKAKLLPPKSRVVLSISCVSPARMTALNFKYRRKRRTTDVLTFEQKSGGAPRGVLFLGDLVLCPTVVRRQAHEQRHTLRAELAVLVTHGLLHLLGYDHERSAREDVRMARAEARVLKLSGLGQKSSAGLITRSKVRIQAS